MIEQEEDIEVSGGRFDLINTFKNDAGETIINLKTSSDNDISSVVTPKLHAAIIDANQNGGILKQNELQIPKNEGFLNNDTGTGKYSVVVEKNGSVRWYHYH